MRFLMEKYFSKLKNHIIITIIIIAVIIIICDKIRKLWQQT